MKRKRERGRIKRMGERKRGRKRDKKGREEGSRRGGKKEEGSKEGKKRGMMRGSRLGKCVCGFQEVMRNEIGNWSCLSESEVHLFIAVGFFSVECGESVHSFQPLHHSKGKENTTRVRMPAANFQSFIA